jgi:hypothetical protein
VEVVDWVFRVLVLAAYLVIAALVWRRTAWWVADKARFDPHEAFTPFEIVWGLLIGAVFAAAWPLTVAIWLVTTRGIEYVGRRFLLAPPQVRREELAKEAADQERRIAELERQVDVR